MAMIATTTNNSIKVKPFAWACWLPSQPWLPQSSGDHIRTFDTVTSAPPIHFQAAAWVMRGAVDFQMCV